MNKRADLQDVKKCANKPIHTATESRRNVKVRINQNQGVTASFLERMA